MEARFASFDLLVIGTDTNEVVLPMHLSGRSIVFASFDGEELGQLGSTSWLQKHAKELQQRAVAYINLDYRGTHPVTASPIFE